MFTVRKNARIHKSVAAESFSTAEVSAMKLEPGSNYFVWPFPVDVIGCGQEVPADFNANGRNRFPHDEGYDLETYLADKAKLVAKHGLKTLVNGDNRGLDLELRAKARPNPKAKMSDADKLQWVIVNVPREEWMQKCKTDVEFVKLFDSKNA